MAIRLAKGLGVTLTEIVAQWEGTSTEALPGGVRQRVARRRIPGAMLDVPDEDVFRRVRGLWELMSPERRDKYWKQGKALVAEQWKRKRAARSRLRRLRRRSRIRVGAPAEACCRFVAPQQLPAFWLLWEASKSP